MSEDSSPLVFLDANVLAKPVTRTLLIYASNASGYRVAWSRYVEGEADRNLRPRQAPTRVAREAARLGLTEQGVGAERYTATKPPDRQVIADAATAGAAFIVTENVDDFGEADLIATGIAAVNPDLFMAERTTREGYVEAVTLMSGGMTNPPRTPKELHSRLGRQHPRTLEAHRAAFDTEPLPATHEPPAVLYRGDRCLRCLQAGTAATLGICDACRAQEAAGSPSEPAGRDLGRPGAIGTP
jgi:hypothetical protein